MSQFKVYQDYSSDATLVSNIFIDHYMQSANDAQIKIYLYLLRVLCAHKSCSVSDLADQFNYTEKDIVRALRYWEKLGLLALDFDDQKNLVGVRMLDIVEKPSTPATLASIVPLQIVPSESVEASESKYVKKSYSLDDIKKFKSDSAISELLFVVEQYLGRPLTSSDVKTVLFFHDELGFSPELIDFLFDYCVGKGKKDFRYIEKVAIGWKEENITTPELAANASKKYDKNVYLIMNALGKTNSPTKKEANYCIKWINEFGFDFEVIKEACDRTVMATDTHRFEYADKILTSWFSSGVHHKSDIDALDAAHEKKKAVSPKTSTPAFNKFSQRSYDYDELEKSILSN